MTPTVVLPVLIGGLYAAGVYLLLDRSLTRVLLGFLLLGNATNLLLLVGRRPVRGCADPRASPSREEMSDPLPQALILTAIVITFGVAAFLLAMIHRSWRLVREEVVGTDEEDRRVAGRHGHRPRRAGSRRPRPGRPARRARRQPARPATATPSRWPTTSTCPGRRARR